MTSVNPYQPYNWRLRRLWAEWGLLIRGGVKRITFDKKEINEEFSFLLEYYSKGFKRIVQRDLFSWI